MINRRSFFNSLGAAILGTAIALKIPETLVPQIILSNLESAGPITWSMLNRMYKACLQCHGEPKYLVYPAEFVDNINWVN